MPQLCIEDIFQIFVCEPDIQMVYINLVLNFKQQIIWILATLPS